MTQSRPSQTAMSSGEIDPKLHGREDFQRHQTGLHTCLGFLPMRPGGVTRAPGTLHRGTTRNGGAARLVPFVFAADDAVVLEFTALKMRVWRYGVPVGAPYEIDTVFTADDLPNLTWAQDADVMYLADGVHPVQQLSRLDLDDWTIAPADLEAGPFRAQNLDEDMAIRCSPQDGATVTAWAADVSLTIGALRRWGTGLYEYQGTGATLGTAVDGTTGEAPPTHETGTEGYETVADPSSGTYAWWEYIASTALEPGAATVYLTSPGGAFDGMEIGALLRLEPVDWSAVAIWVGNAELPGGTLLRWDGHVYKLGYRSGEENVFTGSEIPTGVNPPTHVEGIVRTDASQAILYQHVSTETGIVKLTAIDGADTAEGLVIEALPQPLFDDDTYRWSVGAWNDIYGHPNYLVFYEQRLFAAGVPTDPRALAASEQGAYRSFLPSDEAIGSFTYEIGGAGSRNAIVWLAEARDGIYIGSLGEVRRGHSGSAEAAIGPTTFRADVVSTIGAAAVQPVVPYGWPVYVARDLSRVFELRYNYEQDGARPLELSLPSQHLGAEGFRQIVWQSGPDETGWLRRGDGILVALIYDPEQDVLGWSRVPVAGGFVEDLCVTPGADGAQDIVTLVVRRSIGIDTLRFVEELAVNRAALSGAAEIWTAVHGYCASVQTADPASATFSVAHLAGETVSVLTEQGGFADLTVSDAGVVTLPFAVESAVIGLRDTGQRVQTLPIAAAARDGDSRGRKRRLKRGTGVIVQSTTAGWLRAATRDRGQPWVDDDRRRLIELPAVSARPVAHSGTLVVDAVSAHADEVALVIEPQGIEPITVTGLVPAIEESGA